MDTTASFRLSIDKPSLLRYTAVQSVIELCRVARIHLEASMRGEATPTARAKRISYPAFPGRPVDLTHKFDQDFVSAFLEVLNNIVLHAYERAEAPIEVRGAFCAGSVEVQIFHYGRRFDIDAVPAPDLDLLPEGGMGLFIARSLLDDLQYKPSDEAPTGATLQPHRWTLTKHLGEQPAQENLA